MIGMTAPFLVDSEALRRQRVLNGVQSVLLLLGLFALAAATGFLIGGADGLMIATTFALVFMIFNPAPGDWLFRYAYGAVRLTPADARDLVALVSELAQRADLGRAPALFLIPSPQLQAMAAGSRAEPAIAVTSGLLRALPPDELAAVLAHEIAHIRHGDMLVMRLAASASSMTRAMCTAGAFLLIAYVPILWGTGAVVSPLGVSLLICAPLISDLVALSLSRRREFLADTGAVELTGNALSLARALERIASLQRDDWELASRGGWLRWFRTHPTITERINRLKEVVVLSRSQLPVWRWSEDERHISHLGGHAPGQRLVRRLLM